MADHLCEVVDGCTCAGGDQAAGGVHERHCGLEPLGTVGQVLLDVSSWQRVTQAVPPVVVAGLIYMAEHPHDDGQDQPQAEWTATRYAAHLLQTVAGLHAQVERLTQERDRARDLAALDVDRSASFQLTGTEHRCDDQAVHPEHGMGPHAFCLGVTAWPNLEPAVLSGYPVDRVPADVPVVLGPTPDPGGLVSPYGPADTWPTQLDSYSAPPAF